MNIVVVHKLPKLEYFKLYSYSIVIAEILKLPHPSKERIVETALEFVGSKSMRYVNGNPELGQSVEGFDCSGFVRFVLLKSGFHIPNFIGMDDTIRTIRHTNEFWDHYGAHLNAKPEAGDLLFFSRHGIFPTHIGIVKDENSFIHAPGNNRSAVLVEDITEEPIAPSVKGRILFKSNPIGYKAPSLPLETPTYRHHQFLAE